MHGSDGAPGADGAPSAPRAPSEKGDKGDTSDAGSFDMYVDGTMQILGSEISQLKLPAEMTYDWNSSTGILQMYLPASSGGVGRHIQLATVFRRPTI